MASAPSSAREARNVTDNASNASSMAGSARTMLGQAYASLSRDPSMSRDKGANGASSSRSSQPVRRRDYDICMVFPFKASEETAAGNQELKEQMMKHERESVLKNLQNCGLHVHCFYSRDRDEVFVKLGASAQKLKDTAARMKYELQLKPEYLGGYAEYRNDFPGRPELNFQDRRMVQHIYKTHSIDDYPSDDAVFSTRDKITIVHHIISSKDRECAGINVGQMLHNKELNAYFPLHEDALLKDLCSDKLPWLWMGSEHAMAVRDYFGEKVALYFLFMAFYWKAILIPAFLGLLMQPVVWLFNSPDNILAVPFCIFISVWSVMMPHFWRRNEAKFAIQWGTMDMITDMEPCRPQFWGPMQINPVTNQVEPHYPWAKRLCQYLFSLWVIMFAGIILMTGVIGGLVLRHLSQSWALPEGMRGHRILIFQLALAVIVELSNSLLSRVAKKLNDWENHRTGSEYDKHMLIKIMLFKFTNAYFVLYYIAFLKTQLNLFGMECMNNDCLVDVEFQLGAFVVVRLTLSNAAEFAFPRCLACIRGFSENRKAYIHNLSSYSKLQMADMSSAEQQAKKEPYESFSDFDETLIAHGYASLFAVTSPWVCAATMLWVILEVIIDVKGLAEARRRPLPQKVPNNEPWNTALEIYGWLAAITNITLLVFASHQYSGNSYPQRVVLWVYLIHVVLFFQLVVMALFPTMPRSVETMKLKQNQMAHRCLENIKTEAPKDFAMSRHQRTVNPTCYEQDHHDLDAEEPEPTLNIGRSALGFLTGTLDSMPILLILIFIGALGLGLFTAVMLRVTGTVVV